MLGGNGFFWLDVLLLFAGIPSASSTKWTGALVIQYLSTFLFAFQSILYIQQTISAVADRHGNTAILLIEAVISSSIVLICMKMLLMIHLKIPLASLRQFIDSNRIYSGDKTYDERVFSKFHNSARKIPQVVFALIGLETILLSIPSSARKAVFKLPHQLIGAGKHVSFLVNLLYFGRLPLGMCPRFFTNLGSLGALLMGMRAKLKILAHRYQQTFAHLGLDEKQYFAYMKLEMREIMDQQLEFWRNLNILKDMVGKAFCLVHYFSIYAIGTMLYVSKIMGLNATSVMLVASTAWLLLEYYVWCRLVESLKEEAELVALDIFEICCLMPYNREHAVQYTQQRTSLMISWISMNNGLTMDCLGLFQISTIGFVELLNVVYTVVTFLINVN
nr:odorant receptor 102 precursor [Aedes aegypti]